MAPAWVVCAAVMLTNPGTAERARKEMNESGLDDLMISSSSVGVTLVFNITFLEIERNVSKSLAVIELYT